MPDPNKSTRKPGQDTEEIDKEKNLEAELKLSKFIVQQGPIHITGTVNTNLNQRFIKLFETEGRDFFLIDQFRLPYRYAPIHLWYRKASV